MPFLISLLFGIGVGLAYGLSSVKSPAPPLVALVGLLGIVIGEHGAAWIKRAPASSDKAVHSAARTEAATSATSTNDR